jgi:hypothetical protein
MVEVDTSLYEWAQQRAYQDLVGLENWQST